MKLEIGRKKRGGVGLGGLLLLGVIGLGALLALSAEDFRRYMKMRNM